MSPSIRRFLAGVIAIVALHSAASASEPAFTPIVVFYDIPRCSTCKKINGWLETLAKEHFGKARFIHNPTCEVLFEPGVQDPVHPGVVILTPTGEINWRNEAHTLTEEALQQAFHQPVRERTRPNATTTNSVVAKPVAEVAGPREIVLTNRGLVFQFPDQPGLPNPPIQLKKDQPVKLTIRNDEQNRLLHCFNILGLDVQTSRKLATGESETLTFTPKRAGTFMYACMLHPRMMGKVIVE